MNAMHPNSHGPCDTKWRSTVFMPDSPTTSGESKVGLWFSEKDHVVPARTCKSFSESLTCQFVQYVRNSIKVTILFATLFLAGSCSGQSFNEPDFWATDFIRDHVAKHPTRPGLRFSSPPMLSQVVFDDFSTMPVAEYFTFETNAGGQDTKEGIRRHPGFLYFASASSCYQHLNGGSLLELEVDVKASSDMDNFRMQIEFGCLAYEYTKGTEKPAKLILDFAGSRVSGLTEIATTFQETQDTTNPRAVKLAGGSKVKILIDTENVSVVDDAGQPVVVHEIPKWHGLQLNELRVRSVSGAFEMRFYALSQSNDSLKTLTEQEKLVIDDVRELQQKSADNLLKVNLDSRYLAFHRKKLESSLLGWREHLGVCHPLFLRLMMERAWCASIPGDEEGLRRALSSDMQRLADALNVQLNRIVNVEYAGTETSVEIAKRPGDIAYECLQEGAYVKALGYMEAQVKGDAAFDAENWNESVGRTFLPWDAPGFNCIPGKTHLVAIHKAMGNDAKAAELEIAIKEEMMKIKSFYASNFEMAVEHLLLNIPIEKRLPRVEAEYTVTQTRSKRLAQLYCRLAIAAEKYSEALEKHELFMGSPGAVGLGSPKDQDDLLDLVELRLANNQFVGSLLHLEEVIQGSIDELKSSFNMLTEREQLNLPEKNARLVRSLVEIAKHSPSEALKAYGLWIKIKGMVYDYQQIHRSLAADGPGKSLLGELQMINRELGLGLGKQELNGVLLERRDRIERQLGSRLRELNVSDVEPEVGSKAIIEFLGQNSDLRGIVDFIEYEPFPKRLYFPEMPSEKRLGVFVINSGGEVSFDDLGDCSKIRSAIECWTKPLNRPSREIALEDIHNRERANEFLWQNVWQVVDSRLNNAKGDSNRPTVLVSPDGAMHGFPFGGLFNRHAKKYLIQDCNICYVLFTRELLSGRMLQPSSNFQLNGVIVGGVEFGSPHDVSVANVFPLLRGSEQERDSIEAIWREKNLNPICIKDGEATVELVSSLLNECSVAHIATHGYVTDERDHFLGLTSGLAFAGARSPRDSRGLLNSAEIAAKDLRQLEIVVLSACETSTGKIIGRFEAPYSVARAFLLGGTKRVIGTSWGISDGESVELMKAFHRRFVSGVAPSEALRESQLEILRNGREHEKYWIPFMFFGDWRTPSVH